MKAIGYAGAKLYRCTSGGFKAVVCAPERQVALDAFKIFVKDRMELPDYTPRPMTASAGKKFQIAQAATIGNDLLLWAQVDVTQPRGSSTDDL